MIASIATTHPWNCAGTGLDARVAAEYGIAHVAAIAAVSAQDEGGVHALHPIPRRVLRAQLEALPEGITGFRIGALGTSENVREVARFLRPQLGAQFAVVDPVLNATLGGNLYADDALPRALADELLVLPVIVTPNLGEAEALLDLRVRTIDQMRDAAHAFVARGARAALIKGGHLPGDPVDVLTGESLFEVYDNSRLEGSMRGSGCVLAAALACELAMGQPLALAVPKAQQYVRAKIAAGNTRGSMQVAF